MTATAPIITLKSVIQAQSRYHTDYASGGWAILGEVVINIAKRTQLKTHNYSQLAGLAFHGAAYQALGGRFGGVGEGMQEEAFEYLEVLEYARSCLDHIGSNN